MDASTIISVLQLIFSPAIKVSKVIANGARQRYFKWHEKKQAAGRITALRIARATLGGSIIVAIPFRNINSKTPFLAVIRKEHDEEFNGRAYILEQVGGAYSQLWVSDEIYGVSDQDVIEVVDLDNDGIKEIAFESSSFGSGAGTKRLYVYSIKQKQLFEVTEFYNYSIAGTPMVSPEINAGTNEKFRQAIINYATGRGFLQGNEPVDYEDPKFSIDRWHKENGDKRAGKVSIHLYKGRPVYGASITDELDTRDVVWIAYFKGPLFAYIKSKDKHFIPYSPKWVYEWVKSLADDGHQLWFICHCIPGLFSFDYQSNVLKHYCEYAGHPLPDGDEIILDGNILYFYASTLYQEEGAIIEIVVRDVLMECYAHCMLNMPHLRNQCLNQRYFDEKPESRN